MELLAELKRKHKDGHKMAGFSLKTNGISENLLKENIL